MNIVLTGFMGTGKTAVGRRIAEQLRVDFIDMDKAIEKKAGAPVASIFSTQGEAAFRKLESEMVEELAAHDRTVISTGGGALLDRKNWEHLERNGLLVCLTARTGTLLERLKDDLTRPLLTGENLEQKLDRLTKERESVYAACPLQIVTDGKTIAQVAEEIIAVVGPRWME